MLKKFKLSKQVKDANKFINKFNNLHTNFHESLRLPVGAENMKKHDLINMRITSLGQMPRQSSQTSLNSGKSSKQWNLEKEMKA